MKTEDDPRPNMRRGGRMSACGRYIVECASCEHWNVAMYGVYPDWATYCGLMPEADAHPHDSCDSFSHGRYQQNQFQPLKPR